ncbi:MAG: methyl-accepting chemotaxis protein [Nitrosomonadales bacterium]|nr:methyl-accepting chemotaxis protein [Nitrosomonadales bacterium]
MKNNQPVTQRDIDYPESVIFITKTDPKGAITYTNDAFVEISGFSREELIGVNHNIVRHPDMPAWAFADLWKTIKSGRPWRGVVKNRAKNGDHYWVRATVSPIIDQGNITGYLSLRRKPSRSEIAAAEMLYRSGSPQSGGRSISNWFRNLSLQAKLHVFIQPALLVLLGLGSYVVSDHIRSQMLDDAQKRAEGIANEVIDSANMLMVTGQISDPETRRLLVKKIASSGNIIGLHLLRSEQVIKQFGPGLPEEQVEAGLAQSVMDKKEAFHALEYRNGMPVFRLVTPYLATRDFHGTDCLSCHQVEAGSVNGASVIDIDLSKDFSELHRVMLSIAAGQLALQLCLFLFTGWVIRRFIARPVAEIKEHLQSLVNGNMTAQVDISGRDEMGEILCSVQSAKVLLGALIDQNSSLSRHIDERAKQLSNSVASVERSAQSQAESASSMAAAVEEMSVSIDQVADNTVDVRNTSENSKQLADNGRNVVQHVVDDMAKISCAVMDAAKAIEDLGDKSDQIQSIVTAIKEIADQTNLLALNAAIEAARAGEQGRGFAVVADEVRNLAEKTAKATQKIAGVTREIHDSTNHAVAEMSGVVDMVKAGSRLAEQAGLSIIGIDEGATRVLKGVEDISTSIKEQSQASREIAVNVERVAQMSESTSNAVQEVGNVAQKLEQLAQSLEQSIGHFKI